MQRNKDDRILEATLKDGWDTNISWSNEYEELKDTPIFESSIKSEKSEWLKDFILRKDNGSMILSGQKGSGKTTTTISILKKISSEDENIIPIFINGLFFGDLQFNKVKNNKNVEMELLCINFIKLLVTSIVSYLSENKPYLVDIELEYIQDTINAKYLIENYKHSKKQSNTNDLVIPLPYNVGNFKSSNSKTSEAEILYSVEKNTLIDLVNSFVLVLKKIENSGKITYRNYKTNHSIYDLPFNSLQNIINFFKNFVVFAYGFLEFLVINRYKILPSLLKLDELFLDFIVFLYEKINIKDKNGNLKIVFIFDELDVIGNKNEPNLKNFFKIFKNFLNNSSTHFIFIASNQLYKEINDSCGDDVKKTLFSDKLYFNKPKSIYLIRYLDSIIKFSYADNISDIEEKPLEEEDILFFKYFCLYNANSNYFELVSYLKNKRYLKETDGTLLSKINCNLHESEKFITKLFFITSYLYESSYYELDNFDLDELYEEFNKLLDEIKKYFSDYPYGGLSDKPVEKSQFEKNYNTFIKYKLKAFFQITDNILEKQEPEFLMQNLFDSLKKISLYDLSKRVYGSPVLNSEIKILDNIKKFINSIHDIQEKEYNFTDDKKLTEDFIKIENVLNNIGIFNFKNHFSDEDKFKFIEDNLIKQFKSRIEYKNIDTIIACSSYVDYVINQFVIFYKNISLINLFGDVKLIGKENNQNIVFNSVVPNKFFSNWDSCIWFKTNSQRSSVKIDFELFFDSTATLNIAFLEYTNGNFDITKLKEANFNILQIESYRNTTFEKNIISFENYKNEEVKNKSIKDDFPLQVNQWYMISIIIRKNKLELLINGQFVLETDLTYEVKSLMFANSEYSLQIKDLIISNL